ncbi:MAG: sulfite exporter TauE/SafE family protein [Actinobacteria bacterium]|nr:sulfite exporter TauE/SafE family protein [Actinomycetota bacterium]
MEYIKFLLVGILGGTISGLIGIGGGVIMLPILIYILGIEAKIATALSMIQVFFSSISGSIFHYLGKTIRINYALYFGLSSMAFSFLGSYLTKYISDTAIKIVYLVTTIAILILFLLINNDEKQECILAKSKLYIIIPIGAVAGFIGGLLGLGGGFLFVPILTCFFNFSIKVAVGTSLLAVFFNSIPGVIGKFISVKFNIYFALVLGAGAVGGSRLGSYLNKKMSHMAIRILFIVILTAAIIRVLVDLTINFL